MAYCKHCGIVLTVFEETTYQDSCEKHFFEIELGEDEEEGYAFPPTDEYGELKELDFNVD